MQNTFGLEWTPELHESVMENLDSFSGIEIIPENLFEVRFREFLTLANQRQIPVSVRGVLLSIGSAELLKEMHLGKVLEIAHKLNTVCYPKHLSLKREVWNLRL